ncbi:MAG: sensor domain-containing phosphodiesterase [Microthrixaceae bacterium]
MQHGAPGGDAGAVHVEASVREVTMGHGELASAVRDAVDPTTLMQRVADRTLELIPAAEGVAIGLLRGQTVTYACGAGVGTSSVGAEVSVETSLSGLAIRTGRVLRSRDTQIDPRVDAVACARLSIVSLVCVPLARSHEMFGVMAVSASSRNAFSDDDIATLTRLADFLSVAIGSACDLHRTSNQLFALDPASRDSSLTDEATGRYLMSVLNPDTVTRIDAHLRVQQALDNPDDVAIVFQPILDLPSGDIVAVEALARFELTPLRPPNLWFDDARHAGLGVDLEMLTIARALAHLPALPEGVAVTINVGPDTITSPRLWDALGRVPPRRVVLELTEHVAFEQPGLASGLKRLRKSGVRIAVDDAGAGYSGLTHILKLAPDFIKLDRELISGIDLDPVRRALVTSLVAFGAESGAGILAEGVETPDELSAVRRLGVRYAQGYLLGSPAPLEALDLDGARPSTPTFGSPASESARPPLS